MDKMEFIAEVLKYASPVIVAIIAANKKNASPRKRSSKSTKREG